MKEQQISKRFLIVLIIMMMILTNTINLFAGAAAEQYDSEGEILYFESQSPVYSISVYRDTAFEELRLPDTLRAVMAVTDEEKESFVQALPQPGSDGDYDYYQYGYISPEGAEAIFESGEPVLYEIHYMDGETAYRVYGSCDEGNSFDFYACDENGNITGKVKEIQVEWDESQYTIDLYGEEQHLTPTLPTGVYYDGEVYAQVVVLDKEEDPDKDCGYEFDENYLTQTMPAANAAAGAININNFEQAKAFMKNTTPTSGNKAGTGNYSNGVPGTWVDYVNTIWMNKIKNFKFANSGLEDRWKWDGKTASWDGEADSQQSDHPNLKPKVVDGAYEVYSVKQFRYALNEIKNYPGYGAPKYETIKIMRDLDFNGQNQVWERFDIGTMSVYIEGNGHTFYNILAIDKDKNYAPVNGVYLHYGTFIRGSHIDIKDLKFQSVFSMTYKKLGGGLFTGSSGKFTNVDIIDSCFYNGARYYVDGESGYVAPFGCFLKGSGVEMTKSSVRGCYIYGNDHICGTVSRCDESTLSARYSFVTDTVLCGTGGHSAGFVSCNIAEQRRASYGGVTSCFSNVELYGSQYVGGFKCIAPLRFYNCFSTGKIEGYNYLGGFTYEINSGNPAKGCKIDSCYSTALVGLRSEATNLGGFAANCNKDGYSGFQVKNCFAAGEVGNHTTNLETSQSANNSMAGGFVANFSDVVTFTNCCYDKQTTAMREWVSGDRNTQKGQSINGITGVLTTSTEKGGGGLTDGNGLYPQYWDFYNPKNFGSDEKNNIVGANSRASVSTVHLDTWNEGYDWSDKGVRSPEKVSYNRTQEEAAASSLKDLSKAHMADKYTYDTVRDIVSDFTLSEGASYTPIINGNAGAGITKKKIDGTTETVTGPFDINVNKVAVKEPGLEWLSIGTTHGGKKASRPIRLTSLMQVEAGEDRTIKPGEKYDHRDGVELTSMEYVVSNMVVGVDDKESWSCSAEQPYPDTTKYYEAQTRDVDTSLTEINGKPIAYDKDINGAWVYTEIWQTGYIDSEGKDVAFEAPKSVKVTGEGTGGSTATDTEKQWAGEIPMRYGMHRGMIFEIKYHWVLRDGRYKSDSKRVVIKPDFTLSEHVYNEDGTKNSTALYLGTGLNTTPTVGTVSSSESILANINAGQNTVAAWKKARESEIVNLKLILTNPYTGEEIYSEASNPADGTSFNFKTKYYGYTEEDESLSNIPSGSGEPYKRIETVLPDEVNLADLTYEIKETTDANGETMYYLVFDKNSSVDADSFADMAFNVKLEFTVEESDLSYAFTLIKLDGNDDSKLAGVRFGIYQIIPISEETPIVTLADIKGGTTAENIYLNEEMTSPITSDGVLTGEDGRINFYGLSPGTYYYLVETEPLANYLEYKGMIRLYRSEETGEIELAALDDEGRVKETNTYDGDAVIYVTLKNYLDVEMPVTGGDGTQWYILLFAMTAVALALAILAYRKMIMDGKS